MGLSLQEQCGLKVKRSTLAENGDLCSVDHEFQHECDFEHDYEYDYELS